MSTAKRGPIDRTYWTSLEARDPSPEMLEQLRHEFPAGAAALEEEGVDRRTFLGLMGASLGLAGLSTGCEVIRKPVEKIVPYAKRPEDLIPGRALYFATSARVAGSVLGLLVESQEGRPTKIEGNPRHPMNRGGTSVWAQAEALTIYDPDRSRMSSREGQDISLEELNTELASLSSKLKAGRGRGFALLCDARPSPTWQAMLAKLRQALPAMKVYVDDPAHSNARRKAATLCGASNMMFVPDLAQAEVIVSLDSDFLGVEGDVVAHSRDYADGRRMPTPTSSMNRLYSVEGAFTVTGAQADNRLQLPASQVGSFLEALAKHLFAAHLPVPAGAGNVAARVRQVKVDADVDTWAAEVAKDLMAHRGKGVVMVGHGQPAEVQALGQLVNQALGAIGRSMRVVPDGLPGGSGTLQDLTRAMMSGQVNTLLTVGVDPLGTCPGGLDFAGALAKVGTTIHQGLYQDDTARAANLHVAASHFLEAWGDWRSADGTVSIQQPLIAPLHETLSELELLAALAGDTTSAHELVKATAAKQDGSDKAWRRFLHDGVLAAPRVPTKPLDFSGLTLRSAAAQAGYELNMLLDASVYDGRYANNAWLQELPDPMTKVTWDNVAQMSPATATELGIGEDDSYGTRSNTISKGRLHAPVVELSLGGRSVEMLALVSPGLAPGTVVVTRGQGRTWGRVASGAGARAESLLSLDGAGIAQGLEVKVTGETRQLATTQDHSTMVEPRLSSFGDLIVVEGNDRDHILRETSRDNYQEHPDFVESYEIMPEEKIKSLWEEPNERGGQQWGMSIDLNSCTGCSACTVACQAENNIPVVGRERVLQGREMHWIRLDRYYTGDPENPQAVVQPIPCMHCENAPCEQVCPVAATSHSPEGLNDMAYNRCIGTRYCSNNCPYKVRRFNFFNFPKENHAENELLEMQMNPDVTVRFRGVIEKCTYCVQRIQEAKIGAKVAGETAVADGAISVACEQACPTKAIVFGDVADPTSRVSKLKAQPRDYGMLEDLNTKPRTTYLARIRNPNPALGGAEVETPASDSHHG